MIQASVTFCLARPRLLQRGGGPAAPNFFVWPNRGRENPCRFLPAPSSRLFRPSLAGCAEESSSSSCTFPSSKARYLFSVGCKQLPHYFRRRKCLFPVEEIGVPMGLCQSRDCGAKRLPKAHGEGRCFGVICLRAFRSAQDQSSNRSLCGTRGPCYPLDSGSAPAPRA
jgi:hypothetical protein